MLSVGIYDTERILCPRMTKGNTVRLDYFLVYKRFDNLLKFKILTNIFISLYNSKSYFFIHKIRIFYSWTDQFIPVYVFNILEIKRNNFEYQEPMDI